jgi:hypothetical protein
MDTPTTHVHDHKMDTPTTHVHDHKMDTPSTPACPQVFSSGGTCTLLPSFLGVHPNFWGCNL